MNRIILRSAGFPALGALTVGLLLAGCNSGQQTAGANAGGNDAGANAAPAGGSGTILVDGSSTVFPVTEAVAEEFMKANPNVRVTVGVSGTGGGFEKFCGGETDISNASRPIKPTEVEACTKNNIQYVELPVAFDGLAIVVNPKNTWAADITVDELKKLWEPEAQGKITRWNQVRASWPDQPIKLYGPGVDSGTYDYFTDAIVGEEGKSRGDFTSSEDDNVLVQGVSRDANALGFFGVAYYEQNKDQLKLVPVNDGDDANGAGGVLPTYENIVKGTYQPLSRPIFIYASATVAEKKPEVAQFVEYYLTEGPRLAKEVGYVALPDTAYPLALARFKNRTVGSVFGGEGSQVGVKIEDLLKKSGQ